MTPPPTQPDTTAPETQVSGAVSVPDVVDLLQLLQHLLVTEPGWDRPLTQERLFDLLELAARNLREASC